MAASALSLHEREEIRAGIERNETDGQIGSRIGRHRCTINAEINRNGGRSDYCAVLAEDRAATKRRRPRGSKIVSDPDLFAHIDWRLRELDSPMTIAIELSRGIWGIARTICHETIYQAIYDGAFGQIRTPHLKRRQRKHRHQPNPGSHSLGNYRPIHTRPRSAETRRWLGHLEGDLIVGAYNKSALITLIDRKTRMCWIGPVASKKAKDLTAGLTQLLLNIEPRARKTLTWDQGSEIAEWTEIETTIGLKIFIADPKSPWQRPSNENLNAHIRRYVGKGTDLNQLSTQQLQQVEHRLNTTPRRSLNWQTSQHIYTQHLSR